MLPLGSGHSVPKAWASPPGGFPQQKSFQVLGDSQGPTQTPPCCVTFPPFAARLMCSSASVSAGRSHLFISCGPPHPCLRGADTQLLHRHWLNAFTERFPNPRHLERFMWLLKTPHSEQTLTRAWKSPIPQAFGRGSHGVIAGIRLTGFVSICSVEVA